MLTVLSPRTETTKSERAMRQARYGADRFRLLPRGRFGPAGSGLEARSLGRAVQGSGLLSAVRPSAGGPP